MSAESVEQIIKRAVSDLKYRSLLFADPEKAMAGYDLADGERTILKGLERAKFDSLAGELEERISRAGIGILPHLVGGHHLNPQPEPPATKF